MKNFSGKHFFILNDFTRKDMVDICSNQKIFPGGGGIILYSRGSPGPV